MFNFVVSDGFTDLQAAQWLGLNEKDVSEAQDAVDDGAVGFGRFAGLGYGEKKHSKTNMWKLEERLNGTMSHSSKKKKRQLEVSQNQTGRRNQDGSMSEEEEELGRSGAFAISKAGPSFRENLLSRSGYKGGRKLNKANRTQENLQQR